MKETSEDKFTVTVSHACFSPIHPAIAFLDNISALKKKPLEFD